MACLLFRPGVNFISIEETNITDFFRSLFNSSRKTYLSWTKKVKMCNEKKPKENQQLNFVGHWILLLSKKNSDH